MKKLSKWRMAPALLLLLALVIQGCGGQGTIRPGTSPLQDQKDKYLLARMEYNDLLTEYLYLYELQDPGTKLDWKIKVDAKWRAVSKSLTAWKSSIEAIDAMVASGEGDPDAEMFAAFAAEKAVLDAMIALQAVLEPILPQEEE